MSQGINSIEIPDIFHDEYYDADIQNMSLSNLKALESLLKEESPKVIAFFKWLIAQWEKDPVHQCKERIRQLQILLRQENRPDLAVELEELTMSQWNELLTAYYALTQGFMARLKAIEARLAELQ